MRFQSASAGPLQDILPWVLRGHRIDIVEMLRFPAVEVILTQGSALDRAGGAGPERKLAGLRPSLRAKIGQISKEYLDNAVDRIETNAEGLCHRHQGTWLTIRSCTRSALALLGAKLISQEQRERAKSTHSPEGEAGLDSGLLTHILPSRWKNAVLLVLGMLREWENESRDVARLREVVEGLLSMCYE